MARKKSKVQVTPALNYNRPNLTIAEARKILGKEWNGYSDEVIQQLIDYLIAMAEIEYEHIVSRRP